jgi:hypothetical protein
MRSRMFESWLMLDVTATDAMPASTGCASGGLDALFQSVGCRPGASSRMPSASCTHARAVPTTSRRRRCAHSAATARATWCPVIDATAREVASSLRLELGGSENLEDHHVITVHHFGAAGRRRSVGHRTLLQSNAADVLVLDLHPALGHVDEMKVVRFPPPTVPKIESLPRSSAWLRRRSCWRRWSIVPWFDGLQVSDSRTGIDGGRMGSRSARSGSPLRVVGQAAHILRLRRTRPQSPLTSASCAP